jgi:hypothetical protein
MPLYKLSFECSPSKILEKKKKKKNPIFLSYIALWFVVNYIIQECLFSKLLYRTGRIGFFC